MKLSNIRHYGRYKNTETGQAVNIKVGRRVGRSEDILFYLRSGSRVIVSWGELSTSWKRVADI